MAPGSPAGATAELSPAEDRTRGRGPGAREPVEGVEFVAVACILSESRDKGRNLSGPHFTRSSSPPVLQRRPPVAVARHHPESGLGLGHLHEDAGDCKGARRPISAEAVRGRWALWFMAAFMLVGTASAETWRGLTVAPEHRCSPYDKKRDYPYPQSVEQDIVRGLGAVYGPYTGTCFGSTKDTDIEHVVATSEAHDAGLCARDLATRKRFATDLRNLTLASPAVNRHQKSGKDPGEWLPDRNRCWFAARVLEVKRAYGLSVDRQEAAALEQILRGCTSTAMEPMVCRATPAPSGGPNRAAGAEDDVLARYDDNRNGRITCKEARRHGIAPVHRSHPAYRYMRDGDGDGVVCE